jgi:hypothetical protein
MKNLISSVCVAVACLALSVASLSAAESFCGDALSGCENSSCCESQGGCGSNISFNTCGGVVGGVEMVFLRPYVGDPRNFHFEGFGVDALDQNMSQNEYKISPRVWLGYVGNCGFGARIRFWSFDQGLNAETDQFSGENYTVGVSGNLRMYALDMEAMQQMDLNLWKANVGGGVRFGGTEHSFAGNYSRNQYVTGNVGLSDAFDGIGPTIFAEFRRPIGCRGVSLVANTRGSLLYGNRRLQATGAFVNEIEALDDFVIRETSDALVAIGEIQLGAEWTRELRNGGKLFVNGLWEAQIWGGSGLIVNPVNETIGMMGMSIGAGIIR